MPHLFARSPHRPGRLLKKPGRHSGARAKPASPESSTAGSPDVLDSGPAAIARRRRRVNALVAASRNDDGEYFSSLVPACFTLS
jgi:hypothetical protein